MKKQQALLMLVFFSIFSILIIKYSLKKGDAIYNVQVNDNVLIPTKETTKEKEENNLAPQNELVKEREGNNLASPNNSVKTKTKKPVVQFYPVEKKEFNPIPSKKSIKIKVTFAWEPVPTNENPHCLIYDLLKDTYDITFSDEPDFWFFTPSFGGGPQYDNCVKILLSGENVMADFNKCDYAATFSNIDFGDRHFRYDFGFSKYFYKAVKERKNEVLDRSMANRKFCNFIYRDTNQHLEGVVAREKMFRLLNDYKHVDSPGQVYNNMRNAITPRSGNWQKGKLEFIKDYKFTIAFENTISDGYTTEKLSDPLYSHSIPIYYGNPRVGLEYNKKAFIHVNDYDSLEDAVKKVIELDQDDDAYMAMLNEPPLLNPDYDPDEELKKFFINIIEKGNKPFYKNPLGLDQ